MVLLSGFYWACEVVVVYQYWLCLYAEYLRPFSKW